MCVLTQPFCHHGLPAFGSQHHVTAAMYLEFLLPTFDVKNVPIYHYRISNIAIAHTHGDRRSNNVNTSTVFFDYRK